MSAAARDAAAAASRSASRMSAPASTSRRNSSSNGISASTRVLSPGLAPPSSSIRSRPAWIASGDGVGVEGRVRRARRPSPPAPRPTGRPEVPPARSAHAAPARRSVSPTPRLGSVRRRGLAAASRPRSMPTPWSPSPAIASRSPSSSARSATASRAESSRSAAQRGRRTRPRRAVADGRLVDGRGAAHAGRRRAGRPVRARHAAARECGRERRGVPQPLELVVQPQQGGRDARHVQARDELAALRTHDLDTLCSEQVGDVAVQHEQLLVLHGAEAVQDHHGSRVGPVGPLGQERLEESARQLGCRLQRDVPHARLAVDAQPHRHHPVRNGEQRCVRARQGAPGEGDPEAARALVRVFREPLDLVEVGALLRRSTGDPEHAEVACDPAPSGMRVRAGRWRRRRSPERCAHRCRPSRSSRSAAPKWITSPA